MITRFLTSIRTTFNPFSPRAKIARNILAALPPSARRDIAIEVRLLPRSAGHACTLALKFKDGHGIDVDVDKTGTKDVMAEVDRHSRLLARKEELLGK